MPLRAQGIVFSSYAKMNSWLLLVLALMLMPKTKWGDVPEFENRPRLMIFTSTNTSAPFSVIRQPACELTHVAAASVLQRFIGYEPDLVLAAHKSQIRKPNKAPRPHKSNTHR